ncbi:MAG TPA: organomercurial lyase [Vicinamibacteria bacterium]
MKVAGKTLFTRCALDSLFLPEILHNTAQVSSSCPLTGETIRPKVHPNEIETVEPADTVMLFPQVDRTTLGEESRHQLLPLRSFLSLARGSKSVAGGASRPSHPDSRRRARARAKEERSAVR